MAGRRVNRRRFLQYGVAAGLVAAPGVRRPPGSRASTPGTWGAYCDLTGGDKSPTVTSFAVESATFERFERPLPIPAVLTPYDTAGDTDRYRITMRTGQVEIVPGAPTTIWGYEGTWPGPTIVARRGRAVEVEQVNALSTDTSVHLHGAHTSPDSDGHPNDPIAPGGSKVYRYPNGQDASTLWYHDHIHHGTARNVYRGLAGLYLVTDPADDDLGLPTGARDIPLIIQDRTFQQDGALFYPEGTSNGFFGDTVTVNGAPWPSLEVEPARYRFRILNGSNARQYRLALSDGSAMTLIGTDGGLLPTPAAVTAIGLSPAERVEVVVDFSRVAPGTRVVLRNERAASTDPVADVLAFDVVAGSGSDPSRVPQQLRTIAPLGAPSVTRDIALTLEDGVWVIDGRRYDPTRVDHFPKLGATEVWSVTAPVDRSPMPHPFHIHLVMFQVLDRNGAAPEPWERGWKDTVTVAPGDTVRLAARFHGFTGTYVYHCHNLEHEDHDMMAQLKVVDLPRVAGAGRTETAAAVSRSTFEPGVPVAYVATATGFPDALAAGAASGSSADASGPILLTSGERLPAATRTELERLRPASIVVLGGTAAVPASVEQELRAIATTRRLAGANRYATAAAISRAYAPDGASTVYVASGETFPDALSGGAAAAHGGHPLLLVRPDAVPDETAAELRRLAPGTVVVLGGPSAVSAAVEQRLRTFASRVQRLAGTTRYATSAAISAAVFASADVVYVATGGDFPDALAGAPAAHREGAPLLLVAPEGLPDPARDEIIRLAPRRIVILGGPTAVSAEIERKLGGLLPSNVDIQV